MVQDLARLWRRCSSASFGSALLIIALLCVMLFPVPAHAWWNDEWSQRRKITLDTTAAGAAIDSPIGPAAVLVRLHAGNFQFEAAKEDGSDLRFVAADDKTPLKHQVEKFDSLLGEGFVWVNVPDLKPGAKIELWLYYGNSKAVGADPKGTFDPDTVLVYHFAERGSPPMDSSTWANHSQATGQPAGGSMIGPGLHLDGRSPLALPASPSLAIAENGTITWSAWINMEAPQPRAAIYGRRDGGNGLIIGLDNGVPFVEVAGAAGAVRSAPGEALAPGTWHHLAVVADGGQITIYLDGNPYATFAAALPALSGAALLGGAPAATAAPAAPAAPPEGTAAPAPDGGAAAAPATDGSTGFVGDIDELQIAKVARSAGFIKAAAIAQGPEPDKFIAFGTEEATSAWFTGHFAIILQSVTVDGWVVIVILAIMAAISWVVTVQKITFINRQTKANAEFMRRFRALTDDLLALDLGDGADRLVDPGGQDRPTGGRIAALREFARLGWLRSAVARVAGLVDALKAKLGKGERRDSGSIVESGEVDLEMLMVTDSSLYRVYRIGVAELRKRLARNVHAYVSDQSITAIRAVLDAGFVRESQQLNSSMVVLTISISGGPFLGLLGTVVGVMITFAAIAATGDVNVNAIAPGIAAALVATVAGLGVAIPALFAYNYLVGGIKNCTSDIQVFVDEFVARMGETYQPQPEQPLRIAAE